MPFKTLRDIDLKGRTVLLRADLNVPAKDGKVTDTTRIDRLKPTIDYLVAKNARTVVLSHFGRPKGGFEAEYSLSFLVPELKKSWGVNIAFGKDCIGEPARAIVKSLKDGQVCLLENLRFHKGEEANDKAFIEQLATLGNVYVNDAFSAAHRAHASTEGLAHRMPTAAGFLMEAELNALNDVLESPKKPVAAIVGGAKVSTKLSVLDNLVKKVDFLMLGGGMANTFLHAQGMNVGKSLCEKEMAEETKTIMNTAEKAGCRIVLPSDCIVLKEFGPNAPHAIVPVNAVPTDQGAVDIGPASVKAMEDVLKTCKTVLWNGPMGVFEVKPFDNGTNSLAKSVASLTRAGALLSVAGGGDTVSALENAGVIDDFSYVSTAGGAFLEWMEGKVLPGVAALTAYKDAA